MPGFPASISRLRFMTVALAALLAACPADTTTGPPADPAGTVTSALRVQGQGAFLIDFDTGTLGSTGNSAMDLFIDANVNFTAGIVLPAGATPRKIADVGSVSGLGAVTVIPSAGLVNTVAIVVGHGYVLQDNGRNWRIFVDSFITSATTGGVIGANIKWAAL
jgi:hypothetical protein